jgi:hypothetical protein
MKSVTILFNLSDWDSIEPIIADLQKNKKKVTAWTVRSKEKFNQGVIFPECVQFIDLDRDTNWRHLPDSDLVKDFLNQKSDSLLDLTTAEDLHLSYLLAVNDCDFCFGFRPSDNKVYDFVMTREEAAGSLLDTYKLIKTYLNNMFLPEPRRSKSRTRKVKEVAEA